MARDLIVIGFNRKSLLSKLQELQSIHSDRSSLFNDFKNRLSIQINTSSFLEFEDAICKEMNWRSFELYEAMEFEDLINFRSKEIVLAVSQVISFGIENKVLKKDIDIQSGSFVSDKKGVFEVLNWLIMVCVEFQSEEKQLKLLHESDIQIKSAKSYVSRRNQFGHEFDHFNDQLYRFLLWKDKVQEFDFEYYFWEISM